jgi:hypothetical protein
MDRAYIDFARLYDFTLSSAFFVVRTKSNVLLERRYSHTVDMSTGVRSDQTVRLSSIESASMYLDALRRVSYYDAETGKRLKFLTNNFTLPALTIARIYKQRCQVELFFKWIKQHLRIKAFYGTRATAADALSKRSATKSSQNLMCRNRRQSRVLLFCGSSARTISISKRCKFYPTCASLLHVQAAKMR